MVWVSSLVLDTLALYVVDICAERANPLEPII